MKRDDESRLNLGGGRTGAVSAAICQLKDEVGDLYVSGSGTLVLACVRDRPCHLDEGAAGSSGRPQRSPVRAS